MTLTKDEELEFIKNSHKLIRDVIQGDIYAMNHDYFPAIDNYSKVITLLENKINVMKD